MIKQTSKNNDKIILVKPTKEYEGQAIEYKKEHFENGEKVISACSRWDRIEKYDDWLEKLKEYSSYETIKDDWAVHTNFFGIREEDNKLVGMIDIRHDLVNDLLKNYVGHIGYSVRPSERRKGYATQMLSQALEFCKNELKLERVMISCNKENEGSKRTIINAGGKLERIYITKKGETAEVYWIEI